MRLRKRRAPSTWGTCDRVDEARGGAEHGGDINDGSSPGYDKAKGRGRVGVGSSHDEK